MKRYIHSSTSLKFEQREGLGMNPPVLYLENRDQIKIKDMSYMDRGQRRVDLELGPHEEEHFTDRFYLKGVGTRIYEVVREVVILDPDYARTKNCPRFKSKIIQVNG